MSERCVIVRDSLARLAVGPERVVRWMRPAATPKGLGAAMQRLRPDDESESAGIHRYLRWHTVPMQVSSQRTSLSQSQIGRDPRYQFQFIRLSRRYNQSDDLSGVVEGWTKHKQWLENGTKHKRAVAGAETTPHVIVDTCAAL